MKHSNKNISTFLFAIVTIITSAFFTTTVLAEDSELPGHGPDETDHSSDTTHIEEKTPSKWMPSWREGDTWMVRAQYKLVMKPGMPWSDPVDWRFRVLPVEVYEGMTCHVIGAVSSSYPHLSVRLLFRKSDLQLVHGYWTWGSETTRQLHYDSKNPGPVFVDAANVPLVWPKWPLSSPQKSAKREVFQKRLYSSIRRMVAVARYEQVTCVPETKMLKEWRMLESLEGTQKGFRPALLDVEPFCEVKISDGTKYAYQLWARRFPCFVYSKTPLCRAWAVSYTQPE